MHQQIVLETKKLRQLQMASVTEAKVGNLLAFSIIAITTKVIVIVGAVFTFQACWMQSDDYDIENSRQMFYEYWVSETTRKEKINGITAIDFTYHEERHNKIIEPLGTMVNSKKKTLSSNLIKLPAWFGYIHLPLSLIVAAGTLHATVWWNFILQPAPSMLLDFCVDDLKLCQRQCDIFLDEEYPLIVNSDLELVVGEVKESFNTYLSILTDKPQKLKWAMLSTCFSYILLLAIAFASTLNSFLKQIIRKKSHEWTCSRLQRRLYLFLDVISIIVIILLYFGIYMEYTLINKFSSKLKECRQQLDLCFC
ncbi:unnamed protein product [Brugia timori]|uniref:G_PROTEIN_RECEP_F1_2 domain-containing protein n=1 Tax=Brugia timori TaxID=42155 RepID=A0A0R3QKB5_9BILA|nr:unnamed protein product [Brugia timori]